MICGITQQIDVIERVIKAGPRWRRTSVAGKLQVAELPVWHHRLRCEVRSRLSDLCFACSHLQFS